MESRYLLWLKECIEICMHIDDVDENSVKQKFDILQKKYICMDDLEKSSINKFLNTQISEMDYIYIASIIISSTSFDEMKEIMINYILNMEYNWIEGCMIEVQIIAKGNINNYTLLRKLHEKNVKLLRQEMNIDLKYIPIGKRDKNRIVIITASLLSKYNAPTKVLLRYAYVLQEIMGYDVKIFVCPLNREMEHEWYGALYMQHIEEWETKQFEINYEGAVIRGYQISMGENVAKEYQMMIELIQAWRPLLVLQLGNINPIGDLTSNITTNVSEGMSVHLPISNAEYLVSLKKYRNEENAISEEQKIIFQGKISKYFEKDKNPYNRSKFGFKDSDFLIAIVGTRLDAEVDNQFIEILEKMKTNDSNIVYVIIGNCRLLKDKISQRENIKAVFLGVREDLMKIYPMMNLYLNPKRNGGGYSSLMALASEVPVITLPDCDVAYGVGDEFVVNDYKKMIDEVHCYINNESMYIKKRIAAREFAEQNSKDRMYKDTETELKKMISVVEEKGE